MGLSLDQQDAADKFMIFLNDPNISEMVIEGHPGCGKSFLTKYLIAAVRKSSQVIRLLTETTNNDIDIQCTATTNKAAKVLADMSGEDAQTIHSLLGLKVTNNYKTGKTGLRKTSTYSVLQNTLVIIDEASYIDSNLLKMIRESTHKCKVLYVGDRYQLTSIHETTCPVFTDVAYKATLTGSQRFSSNGPIDKMGAQYRATIDTEIFKPIIPDGKIIRKVTGLEFQNIVNNTFGAKTLVPDTAKIIAWSNAKVNEYNKYIRSLHTKSNAFEVGEMVVTNKPIIHSAGKARIQSFSTEDTAIVKSVRPDIQHGIQGTWLILGNNVCEVFQPIDQFHVKQKLKSVAKLAKETSDWQEYFELKDFFADLRSVYASTVYKAQGSTYNKILINLKDLGKCNQPIVLARMLHVAFTRAANEVILYGELPNKYLGG